MCSYITFEALDYIYPNVNFREASPDSYNYEIDRGLVNELIPHTNVPLNRGAIYKDGNAHFFIPVNIKERPHGVELLLFDSSEIESAQTVKLQYDVDLQIAHVVIRDIEPGTRYGFRLPECPDMHWGVSPDCDFVLPGGWKKVDGDTSEGLSLKYKPPVSVLIDWSSFDSFEKVMGPRMPTGSQVYYEAHILAARFAAEEELAGTYAGALPEEYLQHILDLGIDVFQAMPDAPVWDGLSLVLNDLRNLWGYNPINHNSPNPHFGKSEDPHQIILERMSLINQFHQNGLSFISDQVLWHSPVSAQDPGEYNNLHAHEEVMPGLYISHFLFDPASHHRDGDRYTGCGNMLDPNNPLVRENILRVLHNQIVRYNLDGFRMDQGAIPFLDPEGRFSTNDTLGQEITELIERSIPSGPTVSEPCHLLEFFSGSFPSNSKVKIFCWKDCNDAAIQGATHRDYDKQVEGRTLMQEIADVACGNRHCFGDYDRPLNMGNLIIRNHDHRTGFDQAAVNFSERVALENVRNDQNCQPSDQVKFAWMFKFASMDLAGVFCPGDISFNTGLEVLQTQNGNPNAYTTEEGLGPDGILGLRI